MGIGCERTEDLETQGTACARSQRGSPSSLAAAVAAAAAASSALLSDRAPPSKI